MSCTEKLIKEEFFFQTIFDEILFTVFTFSHMTYLMSHVTYQFYKLSKLVQRKTLSINKTLLNHSYHCCLQANQPCALEHDCESLLDSIRAFTSDGRGYIYIPKKSRHQFYIIFFFELKFYIIRPTTYFRASTIVKL